MSLQYENPAKVPPSLWTEKQYEITKRMFGEGASMSDIGKVIGKSRSAVGGFVSRAREGGDKSFAARVNKPLVSTIKAREKKKYETSLPSGVVENMVLRRIEKRAAETHRVRLRMIDTDSMVTIDQLQPHHCRFPIGDPRLSDFRYCGQHKVEGLAYCQPHCDISFVEPKTRFRGSRQS